MKSAFANFPHFIIHSPRNFFGVLQSLFLYNKTSLVNLPALGNSGADKEMLHKEEGLAAQLLAV
jgi:hypothetical protein